MKPGAIYREVEARRGREYMQPSMLSITAVAVGDKEQAIALAPRR